MVQIRHGPMVSPVLSIGAEIDSYDEYLFKSYMLLQDDPHLKLWEAENKSVSTYRCSSDGQSTDLTFDEENPINHKDDPFVFTTGGDILFIPNATDLLRNQQSQITIPYSTNYNSIFNKLQFHHHQIQIQIKCQAPVLDGSLIKLLFARVTEKADLVPGIDEVDSVLNPN
ncbi:uncharacterized protein MELLADRAFT_113882 [Melampsora larici-populina 98AG31]|uniref:Uncharacterized protein n=1 Tax=Melampsora larici-populina (strain 98AG31 / pathotype 3-4-7) TaxID=747676 RepID=F4SBC5_MELLP|nr:uncharacterized protein MELLADRAFT_113882 [Melampsora larici-populina 98AG31]EGF98039.1 hypothetical protein MELLADRAFT_113882 [Melampsora larici-populina 98AG31]